MSDSWTYKKAGVDRDAARSFHEIAIEKIKMISNRVNIDVGGIEEGRFTNYVHLNDHKVALHTDGVGTKVLIAQLMDSYWEVGWDAVAMNVNDLIAGGAIPIGIVDYIALEKPDSTIVKGLLDGVSSACIEARTALIGGETAIMPDVIKGAVPGKGFDISVSALGVISWDVKEATYGDVLVGLRSNGIHSNGLSLARKVLLRKYHLSDPAPYNDKVTIGEELLKPTMIYVKVCRELWRKNLVKNFAHITGGAFLKISRVLMRGHGANINAFDPPEIFQLIKREGSVSWEEMYKTFNMGIGMIAITTEDLAEEVIRVCKKLGYEAQVMGKVTKEPRIRINVPKVGEVILR